MVEKRINWIFGLKNKFNLLLLGNKIQERKISANENVILAEHFTANELTPLKIPMTQNFMRKPSNEMNCLLNSEQLFYCRYSYCRFSERIATELSNF